MEQKKAAGMKNRRETARVNQGEVEKDWLILCVWDLHLRYHLNHSGELRHLKFGVNRLQNWQCPVQNENMNLFKKQGQEKCHENY